MTERGKVLAQTSVASLFLSATWTDGPWLLFDYSTREWVADRVELLCVLGYLNHICTGSPMRYAWNFSPSQYRIKVSMSWVKKIVNCSSVLFWMIYCPEQELSPWMQNSGHCSLVPAGSPSRGGDVAVCVFDRNQPSLPTSFYSVLVSISVFMALSTVFHFINSPDNSMLPHSVLPAFFLPYWSFQLHISLWKSPSALI